MVKLEEQAAIQRKTFVNAEFASLDLELKDKKSKD
jgi:hypothetical protein